MCPSKVKSAIKLNYEPFVIHTKHPFGISYGSAAEHHKILVRLQYENLTGLGEAAPASYHGETPSTVLALLSKWSEQDNLLGDNPFAIAEVMRRLDERVAGHNSLKAAIEMSLHDLCGKICGQPTYKMLGLDGLRAPMTDFTIGIDSLDMVSTKTQEAIAAGYKILKVKQGTSYDHEIIAQVRKVAPDVSLRVDANGAWTPKQAVAMSHFLAEHNVEFIEQPLPKHAHYDDFRFVKENSAIPIFVDESVCRSGDVARLAGAVDGVVVKLAKTGGLLEAIKVINVARAHSMQIMFGCMIESSLGVTAAAHLAGLVDYLDLDGALLLADDPFVGAVYKDGYMVVPDAPGLGVNARV